MIYKQEWGRQHNAIPQTTDNTFSWGQWKDPGFEDVRPAGGTRHKGTGAEHSPNALGVERKIPKSFWKGKPRPEPGSPED